jgi:acyl-CoA reductase-like NAD-dependent aldehyde dehydrogenase
MATRYSDLSEITSLINGAPPARSASVDRVQPLPNGRCLQGSDVSDCHAAVETSTVAFRIWSRTSPLERRRLLLGLADVSNESCLLTCPSSLPGSRGAAMLTVYTVATAPPR